MKKNITKTSQVDSFNALPVIDGSSHVLGDDVQDHGRDDHDERGDRPGFREGHDRRRDHCDDQADVRHEGQEERPQGPEDRVVHAEQHQHDEEAGAAVIALTRMRMVKYVTADCATAGYSRKTGFSLPQTLTDQLCEARAVEQKEGGQDDREGEVAADLGDGSSRPLEDADQCLR